MLFLADLGLGLLTRAAPALNAFSLGFPLKILITLVVVGAALVGSAEHHATAWSGDVLTSFGHVLRS